MSRYEVKVLPWAVTDVYNDYLYLLDRSERTAESFQREVRKALLSLKETAHQYQVVKDGIRRCPVEHFPHGVMYEIESDDQVVVHSVAHPKREPEFWRQRERR
jgi:plasmid stabilization system protein ParE